jgi:hypothetical protein
MGGCPLEIYHLAPEIYRENIAKWMLEPLSVLNGGLQVKMANWSFNQIFQASQQEAQVKHPVVTSVTGVCSSLFTFGC